MSLLEHNQENLRELTGLVGRLSATQYAEPIPLLYGASIGQHVRHVLEFYQCLLFQREGRTVCYDERQRNPCMETDPEFAQQQAELIIDHLGGELSDRPLLMRANYGGTGGAETYCRSSLYRELAYALDHSVHHMALIKIGASFLSEPVEVAGTFGVAASTKRHQAVCAQ